MSERAVIVIEFEVPVGGTFEPMLRDLRTFLTEDGRTAPTAIHGAIREAAERVVAGLTPTPPTALDQTDERQA